jgi:hypothetical protein
MMFLLLPVEAETADGKIAVRLYDVRPQEKGLPGRKRNDECGTMNAEPKSKRLSFFHHCRVQHFAVSVE